MDAKTKDSILQHIDGQELPELTRDLVDILSPFGLGGGRWTTRSEQIGIDEIVRAAHVYALSAAEICNGSR